MVLGATTGQGVAGWGVGVFLWGLTRWRPPACQIMREKALMDIVLRSIGGRRSRDLLVVY